MAHRHKKGEIRGSGVDISRRAALSRLGFGISVAYVAPTLLSLSAAQAGVVIGDGDVDNDNSGGRGGGGSGSSGGHRQDGEHASEIGKGRRNDGGDRMTLQDLLNYLADLSKSKRKK